VGAKNTKNTQLKKVVFFGVAMDFIKSLRNDPDMKWFSFDNKEQSTHFFIDQIQMMDLVFVLILPCPLLARLALLPRAKDSCTLPSTIEYRAFGIKTAR
jgi:hypothetical protein